MRYEQSRRNTNTGFIAGMGSLFDLSGYMSQKLTTQNLGGPESDTSALATDWYTIGDDISNALVQFSKETHGEKR